MTRRTFTAPGIGIAALAGFLLVPSGLAAATITVNNVSDAEVNNDGACTLREAIIAAKMNTASGGVAGECAAGVLGLDTIEFNIATGCDAMTGVCTIQPTSALPPVDITTDPVFINGYTQPGAAANSLAVGSNAALKIQIDGINAGALTGGLLTFTSGNNTVRGLVINRAQGAAAVGLQISISGGNTIAGNFIGIDPSGTIARGNGCQGLGIESASSNTIGGLAPADRNVIAATQGCGGNLLISNSSANFVVNNYVGTNAAGTAALGGSNGVLVFSSGMNTSVGNVIGFTTAGGRNVLSGNSVAGVNMAGVGTFGNVVQGNFIGTDPTGTLPVPNAHGVQFGSSGAHDNLVGGSIAGSGNLIAFNTLDGITMFGTLDATDNSFLGNSIFGNGGLGIDLANDGVTANDTDDPDTGANGLQNFPVITAVTPGAGITTIQGTLNSTPSTQFLLQFFSNSGCDPSGNGEGQTFLGNPTPLIVTTDASGDVAFSVTVPTVVSAGQLVTGTATTNPPQPKARAASRGLSPLGVIGPQGATSEFSACFVVGGVTATPTATPSLTNTPLKVTSTPTSTPSNTPTQTPSNTPTTTFTPTEGPSPTPTLTPSNTPTQTPSNTPSFTPTTTFTPTEGPSPTPTLTPSNTPTNTPSFTPTTTFTPTEGPSPTPTLTPSNTPTQTPSNTPSFTPTTTFTPTEGPSPTPTLTPSNTPIVVETLTPTPTLTPSSTPTSTPTAPVGATATPTTLPPSATPTLVGGGGGPPGSIPVPTLSEGMLALLALALAGLGYFLIRRQ